MNRDEILKRVFTIELSSKELSKDLFSGQYKTAFKGRGMSFSEVRDYQYGDEVRTIDWNVTARYGTPYVKVFEEERELNVMLLVDVSASTYYGIDGRSKIEKAVEFVATIAFSALENKDKVGAVFFSNTAECYIPPKKGRDHVLAIIDQLISHQPKSAGTSLGSALKAFRTGQKKRSIAFLVSDFRDPGMNLDEFTITKNHHDLIAVKINDPTEENPMIPSFYQMVNPETGERKWVNGFSGLFKRTFKLDYQNHHQELKLALKSRGIPLIEISSDTEVIGPLRTFFKTKRR